MDNQQPIVNPQHTEPTFKQQPAITANSQKKKSSKLLAIILIIVALFAGVGVGYKMHKPASVIVTKQSNTTVNKPGSVTFEDQGKFYSFAVPTGWKISTSLGSGLDLNPTISKEPLSQFFPPSVTNPENSIISYYFKSADTSGVIGGEIPSKTGNSTPQSMTINGYKALYQESNVNGTASTGGVSTTQTYAITGQGTTTGGGKTITGPTITVVVQFHVKSTIPNVSYDNTSQVPAFTALVHSIHILPGNLE